MSRPPECRKSGYFCPQRLKRTHSQRPGGKARGQPGRAPFSASSPVTRQPPPLPPPPPRRRRRPSNCRRLHSPRRWICRPKPSPPPPPPKPRSRLPRTLRWAPSRPLPHRRASEAPSRFLPPPPPATRRAAPESKRRLYQPLVPAGSGGPRGEGGERGGEGKGREEERREGGRKKKVSPPESPAPFPKPLTLARPGSAHFPRPAS